MKFHKTFKSRLHMPHADYNDSRGGWEKKFSLGLLIVLLVCISLHSHLGLFSLN